MAAAAARLLRASTAWRRTLRAARRAEERGLRLDVTARDAEGGVEVRVRVSDRAGGSRPAEGVVVRRERPAEGGYDAEFELEPDGGGFRGHVPLPRPGRWRLVATASVDGEPVRSTLRLRGR